MLHFGLTPFRMLCLGVSSFFGKLGYNKEGLVWFADLGLKFWVTPFNTRATMAAVLLFSLGTALVLFPLYAVELLVGAALAPLAILVAALLVVSAKKSGWTPFGRSDKKAKEM